MATLVGIGANKKSTDNKELEKLNALNETLAKQVEELTAENGDLKTANETLAKQVEELTKLVEETKKNKTRE